MKNTLKMSLFMPPISPVKDAATGKNVKSATLTPLRTMNLEEVYKLITSNEHLATLTLAVRNAALRGDETACRCLKQQTLPYVTPCGVFTRRRSDCLTESSGLVVVDIDHLESAEETENLRHTLTTYFLFCYFHTASVADNAFVANTFVLAAMIRCL